jgi:pimeloyl-ACP methyl ester carboxylesterase
MRRGGGVPRVVTTRLRSGLVALTMTLAAGGALGAGAQSAAPADGAFASLPGRRLWYVDTGGTGAPVVLLHAASGSSLMWERQISALRAAGYRVIAYDRVGWGRSVLDDGAEPGSAAADLQALLGTLRLDRVHLVGTAAGAIVAIDYALSFPDRLRSLTAANTIGGVQDADYLALGRRLRPTPPFEALPVELRELGPSYRAANPEGTARWVALAQQSRSGPPLPRPQTPRNRVTFERLESIRVPSLLITGGADLYAPPPVLRLFAARMKGAETLVVPEAGHSVFWEEPELFNGTLLAFLARY